LIRFYSNAGSSKQEHARITATAGAASGDGDKPGNLLFYTTADGASSPTERLRIDSNGNLGIGENSPATKVHIKGTTPTLRIANGTSQVAEIKADTSATMFRTTTNHPLLFGTNDTERLRIGSSGQIGIAGANYGSSGQVLTSKGSGSAVAWESVSVGITTEAATVTNGQTTLLNLTNAQDHKITCTGTVTISCTGGTEAESHTVRIINSGITTVGFSTFFLFPSGSTPSLPTADGAISLISFTVNRVGAGGTQLLAGASLNFS